MVTPISAFTIVHYRDVLYIECPLREVSLYIHIGLWEVVDLTTYVIMSHDTCVTVPH